MSLHFSFSELTKEALTVAKHTRVSVFLAALLCLVLLAVSPAAHASGSVSEEPAAPVTGCTVLDVLDPDFGAAD